MTYLKPKKLNKGDLIGIISPASSPNDLSLIEKGVKYLEGLGYRTTLGKNIGKYRGYLAGTDEERVNDLHQMFIDKKVKAIFCLRGGYGASRLLDKIDYKLIKNNFKIFVGYSEITSLQMAFLHKAKLITFSGPMLATDFSANISPYTEENFWRTITSSKKIGKINLQSTEKILPLVKGSFSGKIVGGNLAVFTSMLGTKYMCNMKGKILLLEDIDEPPYKIDRMLNQLRLNEIFSSVKGVILGKFVNCKETDEKKMTLSVEEVFDDYFSQLNIPTIANFPYGHVKDFVTIPFGLNVKIDSTRGYVEFLESAVT